MGYEYDLGTVSSVDENDKVRVVTEEDLSKQTTMAAIKTYVGEGTATPYIEVVNVGDDKGLIFTEQISVGSPDAPKESVLGEGDSYGVGKEDTTPDGTPKVGSAWHCDTANTTNMVITSATDVTSELSSDSESTTGLFGGATAGKYILVGSDYKFGGVKAKIDTAGTIEPDNVIGEYLQASNTWVTASFMATDSNYPYTQFGNTLSASSSKSEQWRFGFNPLSLPVTWAKVNLTINGVVYNKYWARFRVTSNITLDAVMQQIKLHTNRFEVNSDGSTEYFGKSRYAKDIEIEKHTNTTKNPANENITIASGITELRTDNELNNGASDGFILSGKIPEGMDTSIPVQLEVEWYPKGSGSGDVEIQLETVGATLGFVYDGSAVANASTPSVTTVSNDDEVLHRSVFLVDNSKGLPGDKIYGSVFRNATSGNANDTFDGNIVITGYRVIGYFWRP